MKGWKESKKINQVLLLRCNMKVNVRVFINFI